MIRLSKTVYRFQLMPPPAGGVSHINQISRVVRHISTHAPPAGGVSIKGKAECPPAGISTHAPLRGASRRWCTGPGHSPRISTHAPLRGASSYRIAKFVPIQDISTHAPLRGASGMLTATAPGCWYFNSCPPVGGVGSTFFDKSRHSEISTHAPLRGASIHGGYAALPHLVISTHAPLRGASVAAIVLVVLIHTFQLMPPAGGRPYPLVRNCSISSYFNSCPPAGASGTEPILTIDKIGFQLMPPCGGVSKYIQILIRYLNVFHEHTETVENETTTFSGEKISPENVSWLNYLNQVSPSGSLLQVVSFPSKNPISTPRGTPEKLMEAS